MRWRFLLLGSVLSASAWGCGPLRLAFFDYPGLYERSAQGEERGFEVDTLREVAARSGCRFKTQDYSVAKAWQAMEAGQVDIVVASLRTPERDRLAEFAIVGNTAPLVMMMQDAAAGLDAQGFEADRNLRLIVIRGARFGNAVTDWVERLRAQGRVSDAGDMSAALRAFEAGRAQAVIVYPAALVGRDRAWLARHRLHSWWPQEAAYGGWALSRRSLSAADRQLLLGTLDSMVRDGSLLRLAEKSMGAELARLWVWQP